MSFFWSPFLPSEPPETLVYVEKRWLLVAAMFVRVFFLTDVFSESGEIVAPHRWLRWWL